MAVNGVGEIAEEEETVNSDTKPAESAAVSVEGRARQTNRDAAGLIWTSLLVRIVSTEPDCSSSE